ncbi:hypothetical protein [Amycolatopsis sp. NBRC 101858]|uniref:hypothetical protein n=1 Tax=Amycolatopsis sp. NBRC 101858 TaxID=3032200 RepID=UPI002554864B|nr:hypothetical protein [Amycolatopsis sp. NBRC 101858]
MKEEPVEDGPASPVPHQPLRWPARRGRSVLSGLSSTDDFRHRDKLTPATRVLVLYLVVMLSDDHGRITSVARRLHETYAGREGHWAFGRTAESLRDSMSKWLGKSAVRCAGWDRIRDALTVQVQVEHLPEALAVAAALYEQATGCEIPAADEIEPRLPAWATESTVDVGMIRASSPDAVGGGSAAATGGIQSTELARLQERLDNTTTLLLSTVRVYRELETENESLRAEVAALRGQVHPPQQRRSSDEGRRHREVASQLDRLVQRQVDLLRVYQYPFLDDHTLRSMIFEQIAPGRPQQWEFRNDVEWLERPDPASPAGTERVVSRRPAAPTRNGRSSRRPG